MDKSSLKSIYSQLNDINPRMGVTINEPNIGCKKKSSSSKEEEKPDVKIKVKDPFKKLRIIYKKYKPI